MRRSTTRGQVFAGKSVAATGVGLGLVALLGAGAILCGRLLGPTQPLVGLSGQELAGDGLVGLPDALLRICSRRIQTPHTARENTSTARPSSSGVRRPR